MFSFAWPWAALLLPLPWLARRYLPPRRARLDERAGSTPQLLHPGVGRLEAAFTARSPRGIPLPQIDQVLAVLVWVGLVAALMRPQWLEPFSEVVSPGYDLMLAVDASRSMEALDFTVEGRRVNRMAVVKGVVGRFVEQRGGDRIGLVVFGDGAHLQAPLTVDGAAVRSIHEGSRAHGTAACVSSAGKAERVYVRAGGDAMPAATCSPSMRRQ
jgi:Ca-activated chloride channel family protein